MQYNGPKLYSIKHFPNSLIQHPNPVLRGEEKQFLMSYGWSPGLGPSWICREMRSKGQVLWWRRCYDGEGTPPGFMEATRVSWISWDRQIIRVLQPCNMMVSTLNWAWKPVASSAVLKAMLPGWTVVCPRVLGRKNNFEEHKEGPQPRQQSNKINLSPGQKYNLWKYFRNDPLSSHKDKGRVKGRTFRPQKFFYSNLIIKIMLAFQTLVS